jgi:DNA sulfur modification protein DndB
MTTVAQAAEIEPLGALVTDEALAAELRRRRGGLIYSTVLPKHLEEAIDDGWTVARRNKRSVRLQRPKPIDVALEDEVWVLLARLGFPELSSGRHFRVPISDDGVAAKQIDILAADPETIVVVECKASEAVRPRGLGKDLSETRGLRAAIERRFRQHYGERRRVGWVYATRNIVWSAADLGRAEEFGITVLQDSDLEYWQKLADLIGPAARHQLQAELFAGQNIRGLSHSVLALRGRTSKKRTFYQFAIEPERLLKIAFISHRAKFDVDALGTYQRMLRKPRLKSIRAFIDGGGAFPTNIVVNFRRRRGLRFQARGEQLEGNLAIGVLELPNLYKSAWVIDGQHRLYGFAGSPLADKVQLPVLAFENLSPKEEAEMFVDINSKQVKVPRGLLVELMADLDWDSPDPATALHGLFSKLVNRLATQSGSPLRNRVVQEGGAQSADRPLTVAGLFEALRKSDLVGQVRKDLLYPGYLYERDNLATLNFATEALSRYLGLFSRRLPAHWRLGNAEGGYLCTNNGIAALLQLYKACIDYLVASQGVQHFSSASFADVEPRLTDLVDPLIEHFEKADLATIRSYRQNLGASGPRLSALAMMQIIHEKTPSFEPLGLREFLDSRDRSGALEARNVVPELELAIHRCTMRILKTEFGEGEDGWWRQGVPGPVRADVAVKREQSFTPGALEEYFDLLDYRKIAAARWELFREQFSLEPSGGKERQLSWFNRLTDIRNRTAHPARRPISQDDVEFVDSLLSHFTAVELTREETSDD